MFHMDKKMLSFETFFVEMEIVFGVLSREENLALSESDVKNIQNSLLEGSYNVTPLKLVCLEKGDPLLAKFDVVVELPGAPKHLFCVYVEPSDKLVFFTLGGLLNLFFESENVFHPTSFAYQKDKKIQDFFGKVVGWGKVELLLLLDFSSSKQNISSFRLLEKVEPLIKEKALFRLVESYLNWNIIDKNGRNLSKKTGIPPAVSILGNVLFNFYLDILDREFEIQFTEFPYARWEYEVLIPIFPEKSEHFDVIHFQNLLSELDLSEGKLITIVPGGKAISIIGDSLLFLNNEG